MLKTMLPNDIPNAYLASIVLGLFYGLTFCSSACLPYITSYIAGIGAGFRKGVFVTAIYNSGRVAAYALIGGLTCLFKSFISEAFLLPYQRYASLVFGFATLLVGVSILVKRREARCHCRAEVNSRLNLGKQGERFDVRAFIMGLTRGLIVCPPLIALLLYSLTSPAPIDSFLFALLFGLGTALSPLFFVGGVAGWLLQKANLFSKWISVAGAGILILLGLSMMISVMITG